MPFSVSWNTLLDQLDDLPEGAELVTPLSHEHFRVTDVQENQVIIKMIDSDESAPLQRDQFETLFHHIADEPDGFELDRLPPNAEPYATVFSVSTHFEIHEDELTLEKAEAELSCPLVEHPVDENLENEEEYESKPIVEQMLDNMGDPQGRTNCPIEGCQYSHRSASSVARHVSGSSTAKHIWRNTEYAGWRDFVRKHGETPG